MPFKYILCRQKYTCRSCLALETHAIKLPGHSFFADVKARGRLELLKAGTLKHYLHTFSDPAL